MTRMHRFALAAALAFLAALPALVALADGTWD